MQPTKLKFLPLCRLRSSGKTSKIHYFTEDEGGAGAVV